MLVSHVALLHACRRGTAAVPALPRPSSSSPPHSSFNLPDTTFSLCTRLSQFAVHQELDCISRKADHTPVLPDPIPFNHTQENALDMAPRNRKTEGSDSSSSVATSNKTTASERPVDGVLTSALLPSTEARDVVKVNNASATEMKHACDDALKRVSLSPAIMPSS